MAKLFWSIPGIKINQILIVVLTLLIVVIQHPKVGIDGIMIVRRSNHGFIAIGMPLHAAWNPLWSA